MIKIGTWNHLEILREIPHGLILDGEEEGDILMPTKYVPKVWETGEDLYVFVYPDSEDRLVATTERPLALVDDFALLKCVDVNKTGAFVDIGLNKDILIPYREQDARLHAGESYLVRIYLDPVSNRLVGSTKIFKWLDRGKIRFDENQEVELMIFEKTDIGFKAIINQIDVGMLYHSEIFQPLEIGDRLKGYVVVTREDGKIDLSLHLQAVEKVDALTTHILDSLKANNGSLPLSDKSSPEDIYAAFQTSKKTFKRAIGALYKKKVISLTASSIHLTPED